MRIGKYEIEDELGHGAMGVVYRARDTLLDRYVAVKLISTSSLDDWSRTLFEREAKAVARMSHPNIIVVHDFDYFEKQPYIVMELLKGTDLEELVIETRPPLHTILEYIYQVLNGLDHAHQQGVIHRDIKPTNIFVTESKIVKIMDFGIARIAASASTATQGFILGTPDYMSPEQVKAESLDGRTDLFSVGTMLYWLLAENTPFSAETANSTMYKVVNEEPPPLRLAGINKRIHDALQAILNQALAKDPEDRYPTAGEMAKEIRKLIVLLEQHPELEHEDPELEHAETVQIPIKRFTTVKKTVRQDPPLPVAAETRVEKKIPPLPVAAETRVEKEIPPLPVAAETRVEKEIPPKPQIVEQSAPEPPIEHTILLPASKPKTAAFQERNFESPPTAAIRRFSKENVAIALILLLAAGWGVYRVMAARMIPPKVPKPQPVVKFVDLKLACSGEKVRWAKHFINRFSQTAAGKNVRLDLIPELTDAGDASIFTKAKGFQIWWPSSELEANLLAADQKQTLAGDHKQIGLTPMVFVMWKERYDALMSKYNAMNFTTIESALGHDSGWRAIGGKLDWGKFTFGFSEPGITNSGTVMLLLITHEYLHKNLTLSMADIQNWGLQHFLSHIKKRGKGLNSSASELMQEMVRKGPGSFDCIFVYENLAIDYLKEAQDHGGNLQIIYPTYNYWNENPLYVLNSSWVSTEQKKSAEAFGNFLSGPDVQKNSIEHGFRPALTSAPVRMEGSPLLLHQDLGFREEIGAEIEDSPPEVIRALLDIWNKL